MNMVKNSLELQHVGKRYKSFQLQDVSFSLPQGSILGFIGENGAGKTTTIKLILDLIRRDSGEIRILGLDNRAQSQTVRQQLGVVFEDCGFPDILRPAEAGRILRGIYQEWDQPQFDGLLSRWGVPPDKKIKELSRGTQMKLSIAAALAHHPKLLILDEATSGLDPVMRSEVLDVFLDFIQDEEHSILLSSHITSDLDRIADYIAFIHAGKLVLCAPKDELLYTWGVVKCSPDQLAALPRELIAGVRRSAYGCEALVRDADRARRACGGAVIDSVNLEGLMTLMARSEQPNE